MAMTMDEARKSGRKIRKVFPEGNHHGKPDNKGFSGL
jgi:hypothetical protein